MYARIQMNEATQMMKGDRVQRPFKERMDEDIMRVTRSLLNLLKRRYPDNWREKLAEFVG